MQKVGIIGAGIMGAGIAQVVLMAGNGLAGHPFQVGPGAEGGAVAGQHHRAQLRIGARIFQGLGQFGDQVFVEGIVPLGAVQTQVQYGTVAGNGKHGFLIQTYTADGSGAARVRHDALRRCRIDNYSYL